MCGGRKMTTIRFERVSSQRLGISTFCRRCQKKLKRTVREEQTVNPWNVIEGTRVPKSREQIFDECEKEVKRRVAVLQTEGTLCEKCKELGTPATMAECISNQS